MAMHQFLSLHLKENWFYLWLYVNEISNIEFVLKNYPPTLVAAGHGFLPNTVSQNLFQQSYVVETFFLTLGVFFISLLSN